jgi:hypothetical protein
VTTTRNIFTSFSQSLIKLHKIYSHTLKIDYIIHFHLASLIFFCCISFSHATTLNSQLH